MIMMFDKIFKRKQNLKEEPVKVEEKVEKEPMNETEEGYTKVYHLIVLDESGSMHCVTGRTISGCNETIQTIRLMQDNNKDSQKHFVSIYLFDSGHSRYIVHNQPVNEVRDITGKDYQPNSLTPLFDALGYTLNELKEIMAQPETLGYVTIITDGEENDSRRYGIEDVRRLIDELKKQDVIFSFIGANIDAASYASRLNIANSLQFQQDDAGMREMWDCERRSKMRSGATMSFMKKFHREEFDACFSIRENTGNYYKEDVDKARVTPENIHQLNENEIYVFGSNADGNHSTGAAKEAVLRFGARQGVAEGPQGQSYAIPEKGVTEEELYQAICRFCNYAAMHPELTFYVTGIGCGANSYGTYTVAPMFGKAINLKNVKLPREIWQFIVFNA